VQGKLTVKLAPDHAEIMRALDILHGQTEAVELRVLHKKPRKRTDSGFFDLNHREMLADAAVKQNVAGGAVYVTLNPVNSQLLSRHHNRVQESAPNTTPDVNITVRRWLLIDVDPVRPADTSATNAQVAAAHELAENIRTRLTAEGWPEPVIAESGNGYHLLYRLDDLPNTTEITNLCKSALASLATDHDTPEVTVDRSVFNASRIVKLHGTVANKGDHTESAPWRVSRIVSVPENMIPVTVEQLQALTAVAKTVEPQRLEAQRTTSGTFNLVDFMGRLGIGYTQGPHGGRDRYLLEHCPFNSDHGRGEAAIFQGSDGILGFKCQHSSCADKKWQDVRNLIDGPREQRERPNKADRFDHYEQQAPTTRTEHTEQEPSLLVWPPRIDLHALSLKEPSPPRFIMDPWLPCGYATLLAGHGGVGKSGIALYLFVCIAMGLPFFGVPTERRRVLYLSCEDREEVLHWRLSRICAYLGISLSDLSGWLDIIDLVGHDTIMYQPGRDGSPLKGAYQQLSRKIKTHATQLLVVDGISDTYDGNENARAEVKAYVNALLALIPPAEGAVVLVGHVPKLVANTNTKEGYSGSTGWHNAVRARWYLYPESQSGEGMTAGRSGDLILDLQKSNLGPADKAMQFSWDEEAGMFTGKVVGEESHFDKKHQERQEQNGIMTSLLGCKDYVPAATSGPRTAYHVLSAQPDFPASLREGTINKRRFWRHIEELRVMGLIMESSITLPDRHKRVTIVPTDKALSGCGDAANVESDYSPHIQRIRHCGDAANAAGGYKGGAHTANDFPVYDLIGDDLILGEAA
jgi:RecA-family ATPase